MSFYHSLLHPFHLPVFDSEYEDERYEFNYPLEAWDVSSVTTMKKSKYIHF